MDDRFFPNTMPNFVEEDPNIVEEGDRGRDGMIQIHPQGTEESLMRYLSLPYSTMAQRFQRAALDLKETVVVETWGITQDIEDVTVYGGTMGTAYLLLKSFQVTHDMNDLNLCMEITKACDASPSQSKEVTFLGGRGGVCAIGAVVAQHMRDAKLINYYISKFKQIKVSDDHPDELLCGRAGYLCSCLYLNKHFGKDTIPSTVTEPIVREIIKNGRKLGRQGGPPLMFEWYGERYWGAAHGLAGIIQVLMEFELKPDEIEDVKATLKYMIKNRFPTGNFPASEEHKVRDEVLHWCNGAPGIALTLVKAAEVFGDEEFARAAMEAAEDVWRRGLLRRAALCHGISGNAYAFLALYRLTGRAEYLYKAKAFACFLLDRVHVLLSTGEMCESDKPFVLFEGLGGMTHLFFDMVHPSAARFPGYEF